MTAKRIYIANCIGYRVADNTRICLSYYFLSKKKAQKYIEDEQRHNGQIYGEGAEAWKQRAMVLTEQMLFDNFVK